MNPFDHKSSHRLWFITTVLTKDGEQENPGLKFYNVLPLKVSEVSTCQRL